MLNFLPLVIIIIRPVIEFKGIFDLLFFFFFGFFRKMVVLVFMVVYFYVEMYKPIIILTLRTMMEDMRRGLFVFSMRLLL